MTRDGTAEPASRDQILRRERGQEMLTFPVQLTASRFGNLPRLIHTLTICDENTYIHIHTSKYHTAALFVFAAAYYH